MASDRTRSAEDWYQAGVARKRAGDSAGALEAYRNAARLAPGVSAPWIGLAQVLDKNGQFEDARQCLRRAVAADTSNSDARLRLSTAHKRLGYTEDALHECTQAIDLNPTSSLAHYALGELLEDTGRPTDAAASYRRARHYDSGNHDALATLLGLASRVEVSAEMAEAEALLGSVDARAEALIAYGLGKAYEHAGDYAAAMRVFIKANQARESASATFDQRAFDLRIARLMEVFDSGFFRTRQGFGVSSERPVFIVGMPRSGTTLTEQIVASHPYCFGAGELAVLTDLATGVPDRLGSVEPGWPHCASALNERQLYELGKDYLDQSSTRAPPDALRVVDKQPLNFWHLGLVAAALPNARIIHCRRDIRDCGLSIFTHNFNLQQPWSTNLEHIAHYWRGYRGLMEHWKKVSGLEILEVDYEDTVDDLEMSARRLLAFLGLDWDAQVLSFHHNRRAVQTPSRWQVRQPIYRASIARWQRYRDALAPLIAAAESG